MQEAVPDEPKKEMDEKRTLHQARPFELRPRRNPSVTTFLTNETRRPAMAGAF